ncbi:MAG: HigA family addiction module antitoxin [Candidatus Paceibacterota bacterium]
MTFVTAEPFLPGEYIKDEMEARGWTHDDLSEVMGISRRQIINLIQGKSGITAETAHALAAAFTGQDAETWMKLQTSYELARAAKEDRDTTRRAAIYSKVPVREIRRRTWIPDVNATAELEDAVCNLLSIPDINEEPQLNVAARNSTSYEFDTAAQVAWYCRARQLAERVAAKKYDQACFEAGVEQLLKLAACPEDTRRVPAVLADMGIRFVILQHLQKTKVDGVALWLDGESPAIAMSVRFDRIDNFWFTLLHELVHVKYRDAETIDVDVAASQSSDSLPEVEKRTNREAAEYLIPNSKLESFISRNKPFYYQKKVVQFAHARGIHPGIVVGQLQNRGELTFQQLRKLLVKVRSEVVGQAMTDGWGNTLN